MQELSDRLVSQSAGIQQALAAAVKKPQYFIWHGPEEDVVLVLKRAEEDKCKS